MPQQRTLSRAAFTRLSVGLAATGLVAGCAEETATNATGSAGNGGGDGKTVSMAFIPSYTDGLSLAYLWKAVLEGEGNTVEFTELTEAAPLFAALAGGDVDVYPSAWPVITHAAYMAEYGDDLEDLGAFFEGGTNTFSVPEYTDVNSIDELIGQADRFGGRIVGIEAGAGLTGVVQNDVIPAYGLDAEYELVNSSTVAMLAELQSAIDAQQDILVTLWRPYWAHAQFPVKDLADPKGAFGPTETMNTMARKGFSEDMPEIAAMMEKLHLTDEQYSDLEDTLVNQYGEGRYDEGAQAWLDANPDFLATLTA